MESLEGRSLLSIVVAGPIIGNPGATVAADTSHAWGGAPSQVQQGNNHGEAPPAAQPGGEGLSSQGTAWAAFGDPMGQPTGRDSSGPGPLGDGEQGGGNPHQAGDPTGSPPDAGEWSGNPHQAGGPTGNPHADDTQAGDGDTPGTPGGGPFAGRAPGGNPHSQDGQNGDADTGGGAGSSPGTLGRGGGQNSDIATQVSPVVVAPPAGPSQEAVAGRGASLDQGVAPGPVSASDGPSTDARSDVAQADSGGPGPSSNQPAGGGPTGPQAGGAYPDVAAQAGNLDQGGAPAGNPNVATSPIAALNPATAPAGTPAAGNAFTGVPDPGPLPAGVGKPCRAAHGRPHFAGQGFDTDPAAMSRASQGESDRGDAGARANDATPESDALLAEALPLDLTALDRALDRCLGQLDAMGGTLAELLKSDGAWPWLAGAVVVSSAVAVAFVWRGRNRLDLQLMTNGEGTTSSWFLESISRV